MCESESFVKIYIFIFICSKLFPGVCVFLVLLKHMGSKKEKKQLLAMQLPFVIQKIRMLGMGLN